MVVNVINHAGNTNGLYSLKKYSEMKNECLWQPQHGIVGWGTNLRSGWSSCPVYDPAFEVSTTIDVTASNPYNLIQPPVYQSLATTQAILSYDSCRGYDAGSPFSMCVTGDGKLQSIGVASNYQNALPPVSNPSYYTNWTQVGTDTNWVRVRVSSGLGLGLKSDDTLWSWGSNANGRTGQNTTTGNTTTPTQIGTSTWRDFDAGYTFAMGIKTDGTLWTWGQNITGASGTGLTSGNNLVPLQIGTDTDWDKVLTAGNINNQTTFLLKTDGRLYVVGSNQQYITGLGTNTGNTLSITQIASGNTFTSIHANQSAVVAMHSTGSLWTWGNGQYYKLGTGTTSFKTTPSQSIAAGNWLKINMNVTGLYLLNTSGELYFVGTSCKYFTKPEEFGFTTLTKIGQYPTNTRIFSNTNYTVLYW